MSTYTPPRRSLSTLFLLLLLAPMLPLPAAAQGEGSEVDPSRLVLPPKDGRSGKVSEQVMSEVRQANADPTLLTAYATQGASGAALKAVLAGLGLETRSHGRGSVDVLARPQDLPRLEERPEVAFVDLPIVPIPTAVSEGRDAMRANAVQTLGRTGAGVRIAVVDLGFDPTHPEIRARVRGNVTFDGRSVTAGPTDHGVACAEIVLDVAPDAELYLVRVSTLTDIEAAMAWAVQAGMDVVSMSLGTSIGPFDGTSDVSRAVSDAVSAGVTVVISAGNSAQHHWMGTWSDPDNDRFMSFASNGDETLSFTVSAGQRVVAYLSWNAFPVTNQDYDLYLIDSSATILARSEGLQTGSQAPREILSYVSGSTRTLHLVVQRYAASGAHAFHLFLAHDGPTLSEYASARGSVTMPADAHGAIAVGAANYAGSHALHTYSSQGPTDDGRVRPLVVSAAGVTTATYGTRAYYGTSAAAPHVAGAAALLLQEKPTLTPGEVAALFGGSAIDTSVGGVDHATGHGWADARSALGVLDRTPPSPLRVSATPSPARPGEPVRVSVTFDDVLSASTSASLTLRSSTGQSIPLGAVSVSGRTATASATVPTGTSPGRATLAAIDFRDWNGNVLRTEDARLSVDIATAPQILSLTPANGASGASVTLTGRFLDNATQVRVNGTLASFTPVNGTTLRLVIPLNATSGTIRVTTPGGSVNSTARLGVLPAVSSVSPASAAGGTEVLVQGAGLNGVTAVRFNGTPAAFRLVNGSRLHATVPANATSGGLTLSTDAGASPPRAFAVLPLAGAFSPATGEPGTLVTLTGKTLGGVHTVRLSGTPVAFTRVNATALRFVVPDNATSGSVTVEANEGRSTASASFRVVHLAISSLDRTSAPTGSSITIRGAGFGSVSAVRFNGTPAVITLRSATELRVSVPENATTGPLQVVAANRSASTGFSVLPTFGSAESYRSVAGKTLNLTGTGFRDLRSVRFNGTPASFTLVNATRLRVTVPENATSGTIELAGAGGTARSGSAFLVKPLVAGLGATQARRGASLNVTGTGLHAPTQAELCDVATSECFTAAVQGVSARLLRVSVPADAEVGHTYRVSVRTSAGLATSAASLKVVP